MILSLDIGGTKIAAGLVTATGKVRFSTVYPTEVSKGGNHVLKNITSVISKHLSPKVTAIGIGIAGQVDNKRGIFLGGPNLPRSFKNIPLQHSLKSKFSLPVSIENDVRCFTLAEAVYGAGKHYNSVFGITLGTGVGGGIVIDKKIYRGANNTAGEIGHTIVPNPQNKEIFCACGKTNHLESFVGGLALVKNYQHLTNRLVDAPTLELLFKKGDLKAKQIITEVNQVLAVGITNALTFINPDCVIVGGGLAKFKELWQPAIRTVHKLLPFPTINTPIVSSKLGANASLIGAALLTKKINNPCLLP